MESGPFYEAFIVKLIWRFSGNLIYRVLSNVHTNSTIKCP